MNAGFIEHSPEAAQSRHWRWAWASSRAAALLAADDNTNQCMQQPCLESERASPVRARACASDVANSWSGNPSHRPADVGVKIPCFKKQDQTKGRHQGASRTRMRSHVKRRRTDFTGTPYSKLGSIAVFVVGGTRWCAGCERGCAASGWRSHGTHCIRSTQGSWRSLSPQHLPPGGAPDVHGP